MCVTCPWYRSRRGSWYCTMCNVATTTRSFPWCWHWEAQRLVVGCIARGECTIVVFQGAVWQPSAVRIPHPWRHGSKLRRVGCHSVVALYIVNSSIYSLFETISALGLNLKFKS